MIGSILARIPLPAPSRHPLRSIAQDRTRTNLGTLLQGTVPTCTSARFAKTAAERTGFGCKTCALTVAISFAAPPCCCWYQMVRSDPFLSAANAAANVADLARYLEACTADVAIAAISFGEMRSTPDWNRLIGPAIRVGYASTSTNVARLPRSRAHDGVGCRLGRPAGNARPNPTPAVPTTIVVFASELARLDLRDTAPFLCTSSGRNALALLIGALPPSSSRNQRIGGRCFAR